MNQVVARVGAEDGEVSGRVGAGEKLGDHSVNSLTNPRNVPDDDRAACETMNQGSALDQPEQQHAQLRTEDVDKAVPYQQSPGRWMASW